MRFSLFAAALVAVLTGFGGTLPLVVAAARNLGANGAETASWTAALCFGIGISSVVLSWRHGELGGLHRHECRATMELHPGCGGPGIRVEPQRCFRIGQGEQDRSRSR